MNKSQLIKALLLEPHPTEGGYFRRTYTSNISTETAPDTSSRKALSSIFYMLTDDSPMGYLHKNRSDIIHYFHSGSPVRYTIVHPEGNLEKAVLGNDPEAGHVFQLTVKGGCWKASELIEGEYSLISEAVSPAFEYEDMTLADKETIKQAFHAIYSEIERFIK